MLSSYKSSSMIFDRADLRVLRAAYEQALKRVRQRRLLSEREREQLAKAVLDVGWARNCRGASLLGAEAPIANEAVAFLKEDAVLALCA